VTNGGYFTCSRFSEATVDEFLSGDNTNSSAAVNPPGAAFEVEGGYRVSGRTPFCSGVSTARWVFNSFMVMDGDKPRMNHGMPEMIMAFMLTSEVQILDTWHGLGMRGTDSNDVVVRDLFVPKAHTMRMVPDLPPNKYYSGPLYRLPSLAAIVLSWIPPIAIALGRAAIEEVKTLSSKRVPMMSMVPVRDKAVAQERLGRAEAMLRAARGLMYGAMADIWEQVQSGAPVSLELKASGLLAAAHAAQTGAQVVDMMLTSGGSSAVFDSHPLQKIFRDAQVIRQHGFVCPARFENFGQVALGVEPDFPLIHF
jgi:alkylation response protein AidB-like acyl-CoA dehydrogenase